MPRFQRSLLWFRRDLRAFDHAALHAALSQSEVVFCAFIFDRAILDGLPRRDRRVEFIHASLLELQRELQQLGGGLVVLHDFAETAIPLLAEKLGVDAVFANHDYEPQANRRDAHVREQLAQAGRAFLSFKDQVIFEKEEVLTQAGKPFSVFTPYKNAWMKRLALDDACLAPYPVEGLAGRLCLPPPGLGYLPALDTLGFETGNLANLPIPAGSSGGMALLEDFMERMPQYQQTRDFPAVKGPSYLSVHLRFGTVSIRMLARRAWEAIRNGSGGTGASSWLSELIWRDFYFTILHHFPHVATRAFKPAYDAIEWETGPAADAAFAAWCEGRTGYPLVDAAMLQLNQTGYMHNRLRMVSASFLVKDLGIDWRRGEAHFAEKLNDFDLAANNGGWQWAASSGCDAQPYFRIFNPVTQSEKFDPEGKFIRRYLPQLGRLTPNQIHAPWLLTPAILKVAGIKLGQDYPAPVVAHEEARRRTLARYAVVKQTAETPASGEQE